MSLLSLECVTKDYAGRKVLDGVGVEIHDGDRIGLIGRNGCGKTTLLRLLTGEVEPDAGRRACKRGLALGYLPQIPGIRGGSTVFHEALAPFAALRRIEADLEGVEEEMARARGGDLAALVERQGVLREEYERRGGYTYRPRAEAALAGLGLSAELFERDVAALSGGEKNRLGLAKLLLGEPDLLLLDEPTNYLDLDALLWLEEFLGSYARAMVVVSHDRFFLDRIVRKIWDLEGGGVTVYRGNYTESRARREEREARLRKEAELQRREIERQEEFVRRNLGSQKTKQAQARRRRLEKMERIQAPPREREVRIRFAPSRRGGNDVLRLDKLTMAIGGRTLFRDLDLEVHRGDRIGIIGSNGAGKSTLLRILLGRTAPSAGEVRLGAGIDPGYYDQEHRDLDPEATLFESVHGVVPRWTDEQLRGFLGSFLFRGDEVYKRVREASGGETGRVSLARIALAGSNLLVLDEPTNHLDIASRAVLEEALGEYEGTILMVSHDRYLLDRIVEKLLVFRGGNVRLFNGNFTRYAEALRREAAAREEKEARRRAGERGGRKAAGRRASRGGGGGGAPRPARRYAYEELEARIMAAEEAIRKVLEALAREETYRDPDRVRSLKGDLERAEAELRDLEAEWETWI